MVQTDLLHQYINNFVVPRGHRSYLPYLLFSVEPLKKNLDVRWINNKVLLYSIGNYIQCPMITVMEKCMEKNIYMDN